MPSGFLDLPAELRIEIYRYLLVCKDPIQVDASECPKTYSKERKQLSSNIQILFTNSTILHEASSVLYGENCFSDGFKLHYYEDIRMFILADFLDNIGKINASQIKRIETRSPDFYRLGMGFEKSLNDSFKISPFSLGPLTKIQEHCTNLKSLTISARGSGKISVLSLHFSPKVCDKVLEAVAAQLRAIPSLQEITMEVRRTGSGINRAIEDKIRGYGWKIKTTRY